MSSPPTIEPFKGTNWEECNHFIRSIRAAAWKEGKLRDLAWMADLASLHFSHKALSWHSRLPQDVCEDWRKLQVALLDQWPPPEGDDESRIEPTPAAAPSLTRSDKANRPLQGALKLVIDGSDTNSYFKLGANGCGMVTNEAKEAVRFRCSSLSNATLLERTDGSRHSWLGAQWWTIDPDLTNGSVDDGRLVLVDSLTLKTSWDPNYMFQLASCTILADNEVVPVWENGDTSKITIGIFCDGNLLFLAADPDAYSKEFPTEKRAKMVFEQID